MSVIGLGIQCETIGPPQKRLIREGRPLGLKLLDGARDLGLAIEWADALNEHDPAAVAQGACLFVGRTVFDPGPLSDMPNRVTVTLKHWREFLAPLWERGIVCGLEVPFNEEWSTDASALLQLIEASIPACERIAVEGWVPIALVTGEGNPRGTDADPFADWKNPEVRAGLKKLRALGAWWGAHEYEVDGKKDSIDGWHVGRAEKVYAELPEEFWLPVAFGEMGFDGRTDPPSSWRGKWSAEEYAQHWLRPQLGMMARFRACRGGFVFLSGTSGQWSGFDVADEEAVIAVLRERVECPERWEAKDGPDEAEQPRPAPGVATPLPGHQPGQGDEGRSPDRGSDDGVAPGPGGRVAPPAVEAAVNPWRGKILTVWNLPADPAALIAAGRALNLDGFEIKVGDGNSSWVGRRGVTRAYVDALKAAGFRVLGWTYNYCDGKVDAGDRGDGLPTEEAEVAAAAVRDLGLDGHTFDLEIECEGHPENVATMLRVARQIIGVPIAAHTWAYRSNHERYPWDEIKAGVDVLRPMIYRPTWNAEQCWRELGHWFDLKPVCPVWGITEGIAPQIQRDMAFADVMDIPGEAYWEYSAVPRLAPAVRDLIAGRTFARVSTDEPFPRPAETPPDAEIVSALDDLWAETVQLVAIDHEDRAVRIQECVKRVKVALKLEAA